MIRQDKVIDIYRIRLRDRVDLRCCNVQVVDIVHPGGKAAILTVVAPNEIGNWYSLQDYIDGISP